MRVLSELAGGRKCKFVTPRRMTYWVLPLLVVAIWSLDPGSTWALQKFTLGAEQGAEGGQDHPTVPTAPGLPTMPQAQDHAASPQIAPHGPAAPDQHQAPSAQPKAQPATPAPHAQAPATGHERPKAGHEAAPGQEGGGHGEGHGPSLPTLSPTPGVTFVETLIALMDHELHGRVLGWRPNDIIIGQFTDNINYYQLGVLEAVRFTTLRLKDSLTRMGDADTYDTDLEQALNLLMNKATSFWFPSAEGSYDEALGHLRKFLEKLKTGKRNFYYRKDNLVSLLSVYKDLLGNVNKSLILPTSYFKSDDYFYYAKGVAHVYYEILRVIRVGYQSQLASTMYAAEMMDEVIHELYRVEQIDPWIVLDADLGGLLANHRANANAPLSEVAHLLGVLAQL